MEALSLTHSLLPLVKYQGCLKGITFCKATRERERGASYIISLSFVFRACGINGPGMRFRVSLSYSLFYSLILFILFCRPARQVESIQVCEYRYACIYRIGNVLWPAALFSFRACLDQLCNMYHVCGKIRACFSCPSILFSPLGFGFLAGFGFFLFSFWRILSIFERGRESRFIHIRCCFRIRYLVLKIFSFTDTYTFCVSFFFLSSVIVVISIFFTYFKNFFYQSFN